MHVSLNSFLIDLLSFSSFVIFHSIQSKWIYYSKNPKFPEKKFLYEMSLHFSLGNRMSSEKKILCETNQFRVKTGVNLDWMFF